MIKQRTTLLFEVSLHDLKICYFLNRKTPSGECFLAYFMSLFECTFVAQALVGMCYGMPGGKLMSQWTTRRTRITAKSQCHKSRLVRKTNDRCILARLFYAAMLNVTIRRAQRNIHAVWGLLFLVLLKAAADWTRWSVAQKSSSRRH